MKQVSIVKLLEWAYRQELPKAERPGAGMTASAASSWSMVADYGVLGTVIDAPINQWGVVPIYMDGEPHADALMIAATVANLAKAQIDIPEGWNPFPGWQDDDGLISAAIAIERPRLGIRNGASVRALISSVAMTGMRIDWHADEPARRISERAGRPVWFVEEIREDEFGRPVRREVDGFDWKRRRPKPGAYRRMVLSEPLAGTIAQRFDRQLWALGVRHVAREVAGRLSEHELTAEVPTIAPWEVAAGGGTPDAVCRILFDAAQKS